MRAAVVDRMKKSEHAESVGEKADSEAQHSSTHKLVSSSREFAGGRQVRVINSQRAVASQMKPSNGTRFPPQRRSTISAMLGKPQLKLKPNSAAPLRPMLNSTSSDGAHPSSVVSRTKRSVSYSCESRERSPSPARESRPRDRPHFGVKGQQSSPHRGWSVSAKPSPREGARRSPSLLFATRNKYASMSATRSIDSALRAEPTTDTPNPSVHVDVPGRATYINKPWPAAQGGSKPPVQPRKGRMVQSEHKLLSNKPFTSLVHVASKPKSSSPLVNPRLTKNPPCKTHSPSDSTGKQEGNRVNSEFSSVLSGQHRTSQDTHHLRPRRQPPIPPQVYMSEQQRSRAYLTKTKSQLVKRKGHSRGCLPSEESKPPQTHHYTANKYSGSEHTHKRHYTAHSGSDSEPKLKPNDAATSSPTDTVAEQTFAIEEALKRGFVLLQIIKVLLMGVAGAGKTHVKYLLFGEDPPKLRVSTALAEAPIRAISRAVIGHTQEIKGWFRISDDVIMCLLAEALKAGVSLEQEEESQPAKQEAKKQEKKQIEKFKSFFRNLLVKRERSEGANTKDDGSPAHSDLVRLIERAQGSKRILEIQWIHFIDSGGQPEFHEFLPAFIHNAAYIMHILNLTERLNQHPMITYFNSCGEECGEGYLSSLRNDQILQCCVQTMQGQATQGPKPRNIIVGTHLDLADSFSETEAEKNEQLLKMLNVPAQLVYRDIRRKNLLFSVNARSPQPSDHETAEELRKEITKQEFVPPPIKIPIVWFLLEQDIRKLAADLGRGVVSFDQCRTCARRLSMNDDSLRAALAYLDDLNIFLYKPSLVHNVIFCDPQVPLDKVTELVAYCYELRKTYGPSVVADGNWLRFLHEGIITMEMLHSERFSRHYVPGLFSRGDLMALLRGLLIVVPLHDDEFLMPALLPTLPALKLPKHHSSHISPLLIFFNKNGCSPKGLFNDLVVFLLDQCKWRVSHISGSPACFYRDCIQLEYDGVNIVTLIDSFHYFQVHLDTVDPAVAPSLKQTLLRGLKAAALALHYSTDLHTIAFFCEPPCPTCSSSPHPARVDSSQRFWVCSNNSQARERLNDRQLIWLSSNSTDTQHSMDGPESSPGLLELTNFVGRTRLINISEEIGNEYCMVGLALLEDKTGAKVSAIESQYLRNAERISLDILTQWVLGKGMRDRTWRGLVGVLKRSKRVALAEEIEEVIGKC